MSAVAHIDDYKTGKFFSNAFRGELSWNGYENNVLLNNTGCRPNTTGQAIPHFSDVAMALGADENGDARGIAVFDYDNDGDLDIAINHNPGDVNEATGSAAVLYRNDIGNGKAWISLLLEGRSSNRDAVGAEIALEAGRLRLFRHVQGGSAYAGQQSARVHFGLDNEALVQRIHIRWPAGSEQTFENIPVNQLIHIVEGQAIATSSATPSGGQP